MRQDVAAVSGVHRHLDDAELGAGKPRENKIEAVG
jgi:hypothetical protein